MFVANHHLCDGSDHWKVEYSTMTFTIRCNDHMSLAGIIVMGKVDGTKQGFSTTAPIYDGAEIDLGDFKEKTFTDDDISYSVRGKMTYDVMKKMDLSEDIQHVGYSQEACGYNK